MHAITIKYLLLICFWIIYRQYKRVHQLMDIMKSSIKTKSSCRRNRMCSISSQKYSIWVKYTSQHSRRIWFINMDNLNIIDDIPYKTALSLIKDHTNNFLMRINLQQINEWLIVHNLKYKLPIFSRNTMIYQ